VSDVSVPEHHALVYLDGGRQSPENILRMHAELGSLLGADLGLVVYPALERSPHEDLTGRMTPCPAGPRETDAVCICPLDDIGYMIGTEHGDRI